MRQIYEAVQRAQAAKPTTEKTTTEKPTMEKPTTAALAAKLDGVDFQLVKSLFVQMFKNVEREGKEKSGPYTLDESFSKALGPFMDNPCHETALKYLEAFPCDPMFEHSKNLDSPVVDLCFAIAKAGLNCRNVIKDSIKSANETERAQKEFNIFLEFVFFFMHLTWRHAFGRLSTSQMESLQSELRHRAASFITEYCTGHWPDNRNSGTSSLRISIAQN